MKLMVALILLFAIAIGTATIIENDYGTEAAKTLIYNAGWFQVMLFLLLINLIGNINRFKLYRRKKWSVFLFHLSFIFILIGAAFTRYVSYEGMMHIREGKSSNKLLTSETYIQVKVDDKKQQYSYNEPIFLNPLYNKTFKHKFNFKGKDIKITSEGFYKSAEYFVEESQETGTDILELITSNNKGRMTQYLKKGETIYIGNLPVSFASANASNASIDIFETDSGLVFNSPYEVQTLSMDTRNTGVIAPGTAHAFKSRFLYTIMGINIVLKGHYYNSIVSVRQGVEESQLDAIKLSVDINGEKQTVTVQGGKGFTSSPTVFSLGGLTFTLGFGARYVKLPFSIYLTDFQLDRYPGSNSPASFASDVVLIDKENNVEKEHRIFMNNVLDYRGFRFFQSSYDKDELGTVLSVNHDAWGTAITYLGYLMMAAGMFFTLFKKNTRYRFLSNKLKKLNKTGMIILGLALGISTHVISQDHQHQADTSFAKKISKVHADKFSLILVQDRGGRVKPINTVASEMLRKITRKESFEGLNPSQVLISMMAYPEYWQNKPMIKVSNPELKKMLGVEGKYVSMNSMFDDNFEYLLIDQVEEVNRKKASERTKFDKDVLAVDERVNIAYLIYTGRMLSLFPDQNSKNNEWYPASVNPFPFRGKDSLFVRNILPMYITAIQESAEQNDWAKADEVLGFINEYQKKFGAAVIPSSNKIEMEVFYNNFNIFKKLFMFYGLFGFLMLILLFVDLFKSSSIVKRLISILVWLFIIGITLHTFGLAIRWYISGHAPWSNAYESMIFIAWATMIAGFIFSRKSSITLAVTGILASLILMVAHLNWMDSEITNLVPVLNSYWLMIHVAIITASYGFLGLGALLAFLNLVLMIFKSDRNKLKVNNTIVELTTINEMTLEVGLFLLTIGTFLGGVWANESWGRYWGWDAKETWALVTVLVYVFVLHLRFIPKLKNTFVFNTSALLGFSSVIMTYFGVNYYLSGLHSYAAGDPVPIPVFVYYTITIVFVVIVVAYFRNKRTLAV
jgi:cytochrome c-type biogenesis protein CcsB